MRILVFLFVFLNGLILKSQNEYSVLSIADSLTEDARMVVREHHEQCEIKSQKLVRYSTKSVVTLLTGTDGSYSVSCIYNKSLKAGSLKAILYDALGNEVEKATMKDFDEYSATSGGTFYDENRRLQYRFDIHEYPVTISFEYEYTSPNTAFIFGWNPIDKNKVSIENSSYQISYPEELHLLVQEENMEGYAVQKQASTGRLEYHLRNQKAIPKESYSPSISEYTPAVNFALQEFSLEGIEGKASNWEELGKWYYDHLLEGIDNLPTETIEHIKGLTKGQTPLEQIESVYKYVQEKCRYVGVQIGIGGFKPYPAEKVDHLGYGDCKGLTNYTKSLLSAIGIESYFTLIYGGKTIKDINIESPSLIEGNHMILCIPDVLPNDSIWLECTSKSNPVNHLGSFIDDRDVVLMTKEGGKVAHTKVYTSEDNLYRTNYTIDLNLNGNSTIQVERISMGAFYDHSNVRNLDAIKKRERYVKVFPEVQNIEILEMNNEELLKPSRFKEEVSFSGRGFFTLNNETILLSVCPFTSRISVPDRYRKRETPFEIDRSFTLIDSTVVKIPEGYSVPAIPDKVKIEKPFGSYELITFIENGALHSYRVFTLKKGKYRLKEYEGFRKFVKYTRKMDQRKVEIIKA